MFWVVSYGVILTSKVFVGHFWAVSLPQIVHLNLYRADCGQETQTTAILVQVVSNFIGSTSVSASVLMAAATWNLCLDDSTRRSLGEADLCW